MKKLLLLVALAAFVSASHAQGVQVRKGYIGVCYGGALLTSSDSQMHATGGYQINMVNFGYLFSEHLGVAATWFGTEFTQDFSSTMDAHPTYSSYYEFSKRSIRSRGVVVGPLVTLSSASHRFDFDLKPYLGVNTWSSTYGGQIENPTTMVVAGGFGLSTRWNLWKYISVSVNLDNTLSMPNGESMLSTVLSLGLNYRIK